MKTKQSLSDLYSKEPVKACRLALRRTSHLPENDRMEAINTLLEMHGTEAINGEWQNGYWCDIVAVYANTGDSYAPTVIQIRGEGSWQASRFIVSTVGDWIERNEKRFALR